MLNLKLLGVFLPGIKKTTTTLVDLILCIAIGKSHKILLIRILQSLICRLRHPSGPAIDAQTHEIDFRLRNISRIFEILILLP